MRKPNFFVVGSPKCGTSSMYYYLLQHPQIFMPHISDIESFIKDPLAQSFSNIQAANSLKEPHFFGTDLHFSSGHRAATALSDYLALFQNATNEKMVGEASVWYLCSTRAAEEIKEFDPKAKIIIMVRNPVDVMFRLYGQECVNGTETIADFESALAAEPGRMKNPGFLPSEPDLREALYYRYSVSFTEQIQRYFEQFGREQTHVIIFDDLKADSAKVYREVFEFLGVDDQFVPSHIRANPMSQVRNVNLQRFLTHPPKQLQAVVRALTPRGLRQKLVSKIVRKNVDYGARPKLDPVIRSRLQQELANEVRCLGELLDRDLSHWTR